MGKSARTSVRWVLVFWMFVLSAVAYLDRVNISAAGKFMAQDFGLTNVQLGSVFSAFILGYALLQAPGGRLVDRLGPRWVLFTGVLWWGVFTALTGSVPAGFAGALTLLLATRFALGVGEAVVYPASNRMVAKWIPAGERGVANGILFAGVGVGAAVATPLVTQWLTKHGWRWSFAACAVVGTLAGIVWLWLARDTPEHHPWVNRGEAEYIRAGLPSTQSTAPALPWSLILKDRSVQALTLSYATFGYAAYIFFTWFFIYLNSVRGLDLRSTSYYAMLPFLAMAVGSPLGGWLGDRLVRRHGRRPGRRRVAVIGMGMAAVFIALGTQVESAPRASIVLSTSSFWSATADLGGASAGSVSGVMNMGNQLAGALTARLTPAIADHFGWAPPFLVAALLCAIGAALWLAVDPERPLVVGQSSTDGQSGGERARQDSNLRPSA